MSSYESLLAEARALGVDVDRNNAIREGLGRTREVGGTPVREFTPVSAPPVHYPMPSHRPTECGICLENPPIGEGTQFYDQRLPCHYCAPCLGKLLEHNDRNPTSREQIHAENQALIRQMTMPPRPITPMEALQPPLRRPRNVDRNWG
jgi:hypothetical protein